MQQRKEGLRKRTPARQAELIATASPAPASTTLKVEQLKTMCAENKVPTKGLKRKVDFVNALQAANINIDRPAAEPQSQPNPVFQVTADDLAKLLHLVPAAGSRDRPPTEEAPASNTAKKAKAGKSKKPAKAVDCEGEGGTEDDSKSADDSKNVAVLLQENENLRKELEALKAGSPMHHSPFAGNAALVRFFSVSIMLIAERLLGCVGYLRVCRNRFHKRATSWRLR